jgi:hypothetical protein
LIRHLSHKEIDKAAWDKAIAAASQPSVYAQSWYLDIVAVGWDALVWNNYQAVMPLPHRKKWGLSYLFQPPFCQRLGVFTSATEAPGVSDFFAAIPHQFRYIDYNLMDAEGLEVAKVNVNQVLSLDKPSVERQLNYSSSHQKNIKKASRFGLECVSSNEVNAFMKTKRQLASNHMEEAEFIALERLMEATVARGEGRVFNAVKEGEVYASCFLIEAYNTLTLISDYSTAEGRKKGAYYLLLDEVFTHFEERGYTFDFEGSNLKGVAERNAGFGAVPTHYSTIRMNRLPLGLKWIKR